MVPYGCDAVRVGLCQWLCWLLVFLTHTHTHRTNSDSALHQSAMNPKAQEVFAGGSQELQPKRGNGRSSYKDTRRFHLFMSDGLMQAGMSQRSRSRDLIKYLWSKCIMIPVGKKRLQRAATVLRRRHTFGMSWFTMRLRGGSIILWLHMDSVF